MDLQKKSRCFGGEVQYFRHDSRTCASEMSFSVFVPMGAGPFPVLYWLSGLTCTEDNFMTKAGAQRYAAKHGIMIVAPDTSPRGLGLAGEDEDWDFGSGAGFYVDATEEPWRANYQMYSYVTKELPELVHNHFPTDPSAELISGHSMGGHGALICALKQPGRYRAVSAFAPICAPIHCPWGKKAFSGYLGSDESTWRAYDACALIEDSPSQLSVLVDQGEADDFLAGQLMPERLEQACKDSPVRLSLRRQAGYDHSYFFIASFIGEHISFLAEQL